MSFRDWLPITGRNRVALCLAGLSLVMFVGWNLWPVTYEGIPLGNGATIIWGNVFSYGNYKYYRIGVNMKWLAFGCIFISIPLNALVSVLLIPFWKVLHASVLIRVPLAMVFLAGGIATAFLLSQPGFAEVPCIFWILSFMALNLLLNSAALLTFRNELAMRDERSRQ
jgi:hypothetical protein